MICGMVERPWSTERRGISPRDIGLTNSCEYDKIVLGSAFGGYENGKASYGIPSDF